MTVRATPSTRIGDAERAEAQRALQDHLGAGRLQVAEFVERFGAAADAVTAAEIAALFADRPAWNVGTGCCDRDVGFGPDGRQLSIDGGHAVATGPLGFATCFHETAYTDAAIERESLRPGDTMCLRTNGHRFVLVTIVDVSEQAVEFGATVWDPPVPS